MPGEHKLEKQREHLEDRREELERREEGDERKMDANERRQDNFERGHDSPYRRGDNDTSPVFHPNRRTRVIISPSAGAGWITEAPRHASDAFFVWMLTYEPLVRALERHERHERIEEILQDFHRECRVGYHIDNIRTPRAGDLVVEEVNEPFEVKEHEGREKIHHVSHVESMGHRRTVRM